MIKNLSIFLIMFSISLSLTSCTRDDFSDCSAYSNQLLAIQALLMAMQGNVILGIYPILWAYALFAKIGLR